MLLFIPFFKKAKQNKTMFHVKHNVEGPYGTFSKFRPMSDMCLQNNYISQNLIFLSITFSPFDICFKK